MTNTGEKLMQESYAETFPANSVNDDNAFLVEIKSEIVESGVGIEQIETRDFNIVFSRLKKSARKRSVSIL